MAMWRGTLFLAKGLREFTRGGYERASKHFDDAVMQRDLKGRVAVVTGANQGLGYQTSLELARRGATLFMLCRNQERGSVAVDRVRQESGNQDVHLQVCDVSSLQSIKAFAEAYLSSGRPLHLLVNNAGVMQSERRQSADGLELSFATNTLGSYALTLALEPALKVIMVSSGGQYSVPLVVDDLQMERGRYDGMTQYSRDKRRQAALAERLARRWEGAGVGAYSMHPGWTETEGVKNAMPGFHAKLRHKLRSLEQGADTTVWLCLEVHMRRDSPADAGKLEPGGFYLDRKPQAKHLVLGGTSYGPAQVDALWSALEALAAPALPAASCTVGGAAAGAGAQKKD